MNTDQPDQFGGSHRWSVVKALLAGQCQHSRMEWYHKSDITAGS